MVKALIKKKAAAAKKAGAKKPAKKEAPADKAAKAAKAQAKGVHATKSKKSRTSVHFNRPKTLKVAKKPKYTRKAELKSKVIDKYALLKYPLTSESAMKKVEDFNTLVFICDLKATKKMIKDAMRELYNVSVVKVNTLITPRGEKKAYIKLSPDFDAMEIASQVGIV